MSMDRVSYDQISSDYDRRYAVPRYQGIASALAALAAEPDTERILEVGCGTARWIAELQAPHRKVYGLDFSQGMLRQAVHRSAKAHLVCGKADWLPFPSERFDLAFCVNAFHHFEHPAVFISAARRVLRPGATLAIIGMDPHTGRDRWYLYEYFQRTRQIDLQRFPSAGVVLDWMIAAGFDAIHWGVVEHIQHPLTGREVLNDPFLQKNGTSQLVLLTDEEYAIGLERIRTAVDQAATCGQEIIFPVDLSLTMLVGRRRDHPG